PMKVADARSGNLEEAHGPVLLRVIFAGVQPILDLLAIKRRVAATWITSFGSLSPWRLDVFAGVVGRLRVDAEGGARLGRVRLVAEQPAEELVEREEPAAGRFDPVSARRHDPQDRVACVGTVQPVNQQAVAEYVTATRRGRAHDQFEHAAALPSR